jgi:hypothetical protein
VVAVEEEEMDSLVVHLVHQEQQIKDLQVVMVMQIIILMVVEEVLEQV